MLRKVHLCQRFLWLAIFDLVIVGWMPTSEGVLALLEDAVVKTSIANISETDISGIIILGGAIERGQISMDRGEVSIHSAAERVTKAFELIRKYPNLPYIFSGYSGSLSPKGISESDAFRQLVHEQGLNESMAHYENQSRNTYENVLYMKPMLSKLGAANESGANKPWLLITSASHMYRSVKIFQKQGIEVIPVPVDYQTAKHLRWAKFDLEGGVQNWNRAVHEVIGLFAYWVSGKI